MAMRAPLIPLSRPIPVQRNYKIIIVAGLAVLVIGLLLSCGVYVYFARNPPAQVAASLYPPIDYARFADPANRENYAECFRRTREFSDSYARAYDQYENELNAAWKIRPDRYSDTIAKIITSSAAMRHEVFAFLVQHDLTPYIDTAAVAGGSYAMPKILFVVNLYKIECLEIIELHRRGKVAEAGEKLEALLAVNQSMFGVGRLIQEMVGFACLGMATEAMREMYPLDGQLPPPRVLAGLAARMDAIDGVLRHSLGPALASEALEMEVNLRELSTQQNYGFDYSRMRRQILGEYSRLIYLSSQDIWTIAAELRQSPEDRVSAWDRVAHPVNSTVYATLMPNLYGALVKKEVARSQLRLLRLQLYLAMYQKEKGRLPESLAQLYAEYNLDPVISPLTGKEYPYPGIIAGDRIDLAFADPKIVNTELVQ